MLFCVGASVECRQDPATTRVEMTDPRLDQLCRQVAVRGHSPDQSDGRSRSPGTTRTALTCVHYAMDSPPADRARLAGFGLAARYLTTRPGRGTPVLGRCNHPGRARARQSAPRHHVAGACRIAISRSRRLRWRMGIVSQWGRVGAIRRGPRASRLRPVERKGARVWLGCRCRSARARPLPPSPLSLDDLAAETLERVPRFPRRATATCD